MISERWGLFCWCQMLCLEVVRRTLIDTLSWISRCRSQWVASERLSSLPPLTGTGWSWFRSRNLCRSSRCNA